MQRKWMSLLSLTVSFNVMADFDEYEDRAAFLAAAGHTIQEDFNSVVTNTDFFPDPVRLPSGLTLVADGENNFIDASIKDDETDVNGTTSVAFFTGQLNMDTNARILLPEPITAFGAQFAALQDSGERTRFQLRLGDVVVATLTPPTGGSDGFSNRFYGFVADAGETFDSIWLVRLENDAFAMDDVAFSGKPAPVPVLSAPFALLLVGILAAVGQRRIGQLEKLDEGCLD
ncbi:hypothetical protein BST95_05400 [Halioglobus japonicus]|uniref:PEP-CTERM sorting domain-containing protein n=1 Tax=Halioglobus japonicus TaxID=930805 RepID=A0AAP8MD97_9GAMM|nr:hypothetical protein [Halioglobus japonicus]AQA17754.1 hypothetical protein BST95_05400 [Halioglobus japonicus]PLW85703.1 hypothetical protein C0029_13950 [Halioglobus japonicus]GHD17065.1 hypothetical protein GCM10007052_23160 [Halioglobus japonicus]